MAKTEKKLGTLLTIWLVIMVIANLFGALTYLILYKLVFIEKIAAVLPALPSTAIYILGIIGILNVIFTIFLFKWKKWAFFAYCGSAGIVFIINLIIGTGIVAALCGLIGPVILYLIMRPKWNLFE